MTTLTLNPRNVPARLVGPKYLTPPKNARKATWQLLDDDNLLEHAQMKVSQNGIADAESFSNAFRGIACELARRGLPVEELRY